MQSPNVASYRVRVFHQIVMYRPFVRSLSSPCSPLPALSLFWHGKIELHRVSEDDMLTHYEKLAYPTLSMRIGPLRVMPMAYVAELSSVQIYKMPKPVLLLPTKVLKLRGE